MKLSKKNLALLEEGFAGYTPNLLKVCILDVGFFKVEKVAVDVEKNIDKSKTAYFCIGKFKRKAFIKALINHGMLEVAHNCYVNTAYFCRLEEEPNNDPEETEYLHNVSLYGRHGEVIKVSLNEDEYVNFIEALRKVRVDLLYIFENGHKLLNT